VRLSAGTLKIGGAIEPPMENNLLCSIVWPIDFYCNSPANPFLLVSARKRAQPERARLSGKQTQKFTK
jgi:hypothetical protein